jgi:hypothetical protein
MRMRRTLLLTATAVMLAGCGDHKLVLKVDALSFVDPASRQADFGPIPIFPGGLWAGEIPLIDDQHVSMLQGLGDAVDIQSVTIGFGALVNDFDGSGEDTVRIYMSDEQTPPRTTAPVISLGIALSPGRTDTLRAVLADDPRLIALFASKQMRVSVTTSLRGPLLGSDLSGRFTLTAIDGVVIGRSKGY